MNIWLELYNDKYRCLSVPLSVCVYLLFSEETAVRKTTEHGEKVPVCL